MEGSHGFKLTFYKKSKFPTPEQIEKKLKLSLGLFEAAFEIKKFQLSKKHPNKTDRELNYLTMELFEKGSH